MSETSTFLSDVDRLTTASHRIVHRDHGTEVLTTSGLLSQLRAAIQQGTEGAGGSSSFGSRPTIDASAQDLLIEISSQAREALNAARGRPAPIGLAESHIRLWAAAVNESTMVRVTRRRQYPDRMVSEWRRRGDTRPAVYTELLEMPARRMVRHWCDQIEAFFFPPDTREIKAACPACDTRYVYREAEGQTTQRSALSFIRNEGVTVEARCASCAASWSPAQFEWLARAIGANADRSELKRMGVVVDDTPEMDGVA